MIFYIIVYVFFFSDVCILYYISRCVSFWGYCINRALKESTVCEENNMMNQNKNSIHLGSIRIGNIIDSNKILLRIYIFAKKGNWSLCIPAQNKLYWIIIFKFHISYFFLGSAHFFFFYFFWGGLLGCHKQQ